MPLEYFSATNFRCLAQIEFEVAPDVTLIFGDNASGKTSILEAVAYLGRGRSFRGASVSELIRHGEREFILFGRVEHAERVFNIGAGNGPRGLEVRVDGESGGGAAALAAALPIQIVDPNVHDLVAGPPELRRRYIDWVAFHVEHGYLDTWRRFQRSLKQRNAALRANATNEAMHAWTSEFITAAEALDQGRRAALEVITGPLQEAVQDLLQGAASFSYDGGWNSDRGLLVALEAGAERERQLGSTQYGPHRGDLRLSQDSHKARSVVSRGQQKLLAAAMVLAATEVGQAATGQPMLLLLDDPAAELDNSALQRLMSRVLRLGCQVVATSLRPDASLFIEPAAVFHVEHGRLSRR